ncbi:MAG: hypothetical protein EAZ95_14585 [Bacteroidetes bacterium]|nr:MAG: hypothetical protein EAZ95_14585 [Bacteroidota bacterium]
MEKSDNQLVELVNLFHQYTQESSSASIGDFCKHYLASEKMQEIEKYPPPHGREIPLEGLLGRTYGKLWRFVNLELKQMAETVEMDTVEEIWYLGAMFELPSPTKSDLINHHMAEFSSGIAVINRLLAKGFLEEFPDEMDKRAKRLRITEAGKGKLFMCFEHLEMMSKDIFKYLSQDEKEILYQILAKLERNHALKYEKTKQKA